MRTLVFPRCGGSNVVTDTSSIVPNDDVTADGSCGNTASGLTKFTVKNRRCAASADAIITVAVIGGSELELKASPAIAIVAPNGPPKAIVAGTDEASSIDA